MEKITNLDKAAVILLSLDKQDATFIMQQMSFEEVERVSAAMYNLKSITPAEKTKVINNFKQRIENLDITFGNKNATSTILSAFLGKQDVEKILSKLQNTNDLWDTINIIDSEVIALYLMREKVNTIAIILSKINHSKVASILGFMEDNLAREVINAMVTLEDVSKDIMHEIQSVLRRDLVNGIKQDIKAKNIPKMISSIISSIKPNKRKIYIQLLQEKHPDLYNKVEELIFTFEDLIRIDPMSMSVLIQKLDQSTIIYALKNAKEELQNLFFNSMTKRMSDIIKNEMQDLVRVRKADVINAQTTIVFVAKDMLNKGEISEIDEDTI